MPSVATTSDTFKDKHQISEDSAPVHELVIAYLEIPAPARSEVHRPNLGSLRRRQFVSRSSKSGFRNFGSSLFNAQTAASSVAFGALRNAFDTTATSNQPFGDTSGGFGSSGTVGISTGRLISQEQ